MTVLFPSGRLSRHFLTSDSTCVGFLHSLAFFYCTLHFSPRLGRCFYQQSFAIAGRVVELSLTSHKLLLKCL